MDSKDSCCALVEIRLEVIVRLFESVDGACKDNVEGFIENTSWERTEWAISESMATAELINGSLKVKLRSLSV